MASDDPILVSATPPVLGRASPAAARPSRLRAGATAADAAYRADGGDLAGWVVRAASVAGVRHRLAGAGPQDAYAWRVIGSRAGADDPAGVEDPAGAGSLVVAIADGVGTVDGAAAAAATAVTAACDAVAETVAARSFGTQRWWSAVVEAADRGVRAAGGATTLVVACVDSDGIGSLARVGDSTALVLAAGRWQEIWPPLGVDGAPVSTETAALPGAPRPEIAVVGIEAGTALVLMTDGVANPFRDGPTTVAPALAETLAEPPTPLGLAVVTDFARQGCFDDRTVVGVWAGARRY